VRKILFIALIVGLLLTALSVAGVSAAPPAQQGITGKGVALFVQLYEDAQLQTVVRGAAGQIWQGSVVQVSSPAGGVRYVTCPATGAGGWVAEAAIGSSIVLLSGAFLPLELTYGAVGVMQSASNCQVWLECNGYSTAGTGRVWDWLDRSGILTTHPEDCVPYYNMPRPPGCYP